MMELVSRVSRGRRLPQACVVAAALCGALPTTAVAQSTSSLEPRVRIETSAGDFVIQLDTVRAPLTAENFLRYVRDGFYDGLMMHRIVANFVVQGGGYTPDFRDRGTRAAIPNESGNGLSNQRGSVGMARSESPHSATSQFYVNVKDNAGLNPLPSRWGYAVFGQIVEGMDVIDRMAYVPTSERAGYTDTPLEPIVIRRAVVIGEDRPQVAPAGTAPVPDAAGDGETDEPQDGGEADDSSGEATGEKRT